MSTETNKRLRGLFGEPGSWQKAIFHIMRVTRGRQTTIQYVGHPFRVVLGAEAQLPWASGPTHTAGILDNGYLSGAERFRVRLRVESDF